MDPSAEILEIEKIVEGGLGLARGKQGVVLVPGTLPGETVEAELIETKHSVRKGRIVRVITASPRRQDSPCPLFLNCGGCDFLHTPYDYELELKQSILAETIERIGKLKPTFLPPVPAPKPEFYRMFVQLKIDPQGRIGLFRRDSHEVVPFEGETFTGCRLQNDRLNRSAAALQGMLAGFQVIKFRMGDEGFVINLTSESDKQPDDALTARIRDLGVTGFLVNDRLLFGSPQVLYIYGEAPGPTYRFRVSHDAFFQIEPVVVQRIVHRVREILAAEFGGKRLMENMLDLYAGVGAFGISLASSVLGVFCVEVGESAVEDLEFNMAENRVTNLIAHRGTVKSFLKRFHGQIGLCLVDPPRAGLEPEVRDSILKMSPPLIVYISCHPATLARDLAGFTASGRYRVDSVQLFDQFGRTHHLESLTVLKKI